MKKYNWAEAGSLLLILGGIWFLWDSIAIYPLKILVVFFHELSHGLMAIVTGGSIVEIKVVKEQGGHCITQGGSRFWILTAGYLGSLLWGGLILVVATRTKHDQKISTSIGVILILATVLWVRPFTEFGFLFGILAGASLVAIGSFLGHKVNDYVLKIIGLTSCAYAILDIKSDTIDRSELPSDARMLAEDFGGGTVFWGGLWISIAVVGTLFFLSLSCKRSGPPKDA